MSRPTPSTTIASGNNSRLHSRRGDQNLIEHISDHRTRETNQTYLRQPSKGILKKSTVFENTSSSDGGFTAEMYQARKKLGQSKSISFLDLKMKEDRSSKLISATENC